MAPIIQAEWKLKRFSFHAQIHRFCCQNPIPITITREDSFTILILIYDLLNKFYKGKVHDLIRLKSFSMSSKIDVSYKRKLSGIHIIYKIHWNMMYNQNKLFVIFIYFFLLLNSFLYFQFIFFLLISFLYCFLFW